MHRLCRAVGIVFASVIFLWLGSDLARAQDATPTVRIESASDPQTFFNPCVDPPQTMHTPGSVELTRSGDMSESLDVQYAVSGPDGDSTGTVTFEAASPSAVVDVAPQAPGDIEWVIVNGDAYDLGDRPRVTLTTGFATPTCATDASTTTSTVQVLPRTGAGSSAPSLLFASALSILAGTGLVLLARRQS